ncbi:hypothetical protein [Staphylococcus sp. IVB6227]|uniref:hypothetical protein n=1 Tax=Staphylococcus sp. IVB6227 TaxID=2989768 RepID=UPI0021CEB593|nr:hypothetical protein [Staphylococcus sp. IVB6227]UXR77800.1 hypothetical protein MUA92_08095 [Staphylococcus sp. IVB6227]
MNEVIEYKDEYGVIYLTSFNTNVEVVLNNLYGMIAPIDYSDIKDNDVFLTQVQTIELLSSMEKKKHFQAVKNIDKLSSMQIKNPDAEILNKALKLQSEYKYREAHFEYRNLLSINPKNRLVFFAIHMLEFNLGWQKEMVDTSRMIVNYLDNRDYYFGFAKGIESFSLIENGYFEEGKESADIALKINSNDVYAIHAVCHYFYETGQYAEGIHWMEKVITNWRFNQGMRIHIWWHLAIFHLINLNFEKVEMILRDQVMIKNKEDGLEDLDATALIWRLYLLDANNSLYYKALDNWEYYLDESHFIFNDLHALMAYILKNDNQKINAYFEKVINRKSNKLTINQLDLLYGFYYYGQRKYTESSEKLSLCINDSSFGGSNAQRDVIALTLFFAFLNSNNVEKAEELLYSDRAFKHKSKMKELLLKKLGVKNYV